MMIRRRQFRRGQVLVLFALMLPILLGFVALAVDVVYAFVVKAAVVTALDSAALAGSRAIGSGNEAAVIERTFRANLPDDYLIRGHAQLTSSGVVREADGTHSISLVAEVESPTLFLNVFGYSGWPVRAYAKAGRRDVNIMLVLDRSTSLEMAHAWDDVQSAASFFVGQFNDAYDKVGLVSFGTTSRIDYAPKLNFKSDLLGMIKSMRVIGTSYTNSTMGMYNAYSALKTLNDPNRENVVVFFTDGNTTAMPGNFDVRGPSLPEPNCPSDLYEGVIRGYASVPVPSGYGSKDARGIYNPVPQTSGSRDYTTVPCRLGSSPDGVTPSTVLTGGYRTTWQPPGSSGLSISIYGYNTGNVSANSAYVDYGANVTRIGENLFVNMARTARQDTLRMRIYVIGLGDSVDANVLRCIANVPNSPSSPCQASSSEPAGLYVYAPTPSQLTSAFRQVASAISHLIQ